MVQALKRSCPRRPPQALAAAGLLGLIFMSVLIFTGPSPAEVLLKRKASTVAYETNEDDDFAGGASLKTDPELEQFLKKADQFAEDKRYDLACVLWQRVLDESSGTVMTRDSWTQKTSRRMYRRYRSVAGEIEQTIAELPPEGLRT